MDYKLFRDHRTRQFRYRGIFLGIGFEERFAKWSISSDIRVQITQESVRLVALIGLKMFSTHIACKKSLEIFLLARFRRSVLGKGLKIAIFGLL